LAQIRELSSAQKDKQTPIIESNKAIKLLCILFE